MGTTYYDVAPDGSQWAIRLAGHDETWFYQTQDEALSIAMDAARSMWEKSGLRCGVRLQQPDGEWQRKRLFGAVTPFPKSTVR